MKIEMWPLDRVKPYERNPRVNDGAVEAVARSIREFGFRVPVVVDEAGVIICGHTRLLAAKELGLAEVPVHVATGLTPEQVKAYRVADNKLHELATWDYDLLPIELGELQGMDVDLESLGFSADELAKLMGEEPKAGLTDPDEVPEPPEEPVTQPGDLWILGEHRLLCGDATKAEDVDRLMDGGKANMVFTDPPWNVAIGLDSNPKHRQREGLANDNLSPEDFARFLAAAAGSFARIAAGDVYCVLGAAEWPQLDTALRGAGFHWSATVIWAKDVFVLGRSKYHRRYEPIWYGWPAKGKSTYRAGRDQDDVWDIPRPKRSEEHPTMKPVALVERAIRNSSVPGAVVADLFCGSGTTLLAAERLERKCRGMELSPKYCDVIVKRWEAFTGGKAERVSETAPVETGAVLEEEKA